MHYKVRENFKFYRVHISVKICKRVQNQFYFSLKKNAPTDPVSILNKGWNLAGF